MDFIVRHIGEATSCCGTAATKGPGRQARRKLRLTFTMQFVLGIRRAFLGQRAIRTDRRKRGWSPQLVSAIRSEDQVERKPHISFFPHCKYLNMLSIISLLLFSFSKICVAIRIDWFSPEPYKPSSSQKEIWFEREIKELIWTSDMPEYGIYLTQNRHESPLAKWVCIFRQSLDILFPLQKLRLTNSPLGKGKNETAQTHMLWTVQTFLSFDLSLTNSFFLQINDGNHNFIATNNFVIKNATQNTTDTCPPNNITTALPLGLGVGLGVPLLLALAGIAFLLTSSRRGERDGLPYTKIGADTIVEEPRKDFYYHYEAPSQNEVHEVSHNDVVHEAPGGAIPYRQG